MGKIVLTNNQTWRDNLDKEFSETGFIRSGQTDDCLSYHKLNIKNENFYQEGNDYIACAGTLIYKENLGRDALKQMLSDAKTSTVNDLRNHSLGMYVVAIKIDGMTRIFCDDERMYKFFYYSDGKHYLATPTVFHIAQQTKDSLDIDEVYKYISVRGYFSEKTYFENIKVLDCDEVIEISATQDFTVKKVNLTYMHHDTSSFEKTAQELEEELRDVIRIRNKVMKKSILFMTGGVDSRLEYGLHLAAGDQVSIGYWLGKDVVTNGRKEDTKLSREITEYFGGEFHLFDVSEDIKDSFQNINQATCSKYGEHAATYSNNTKWKKIFENLDRSIDFINFGAVAAPLRDQWHFDKEYKKPYDLDQFIVDEYGQLHVASCIFKDKTNEIYKGVRDDVEKKFIQGNMNINDLTFEDCSYLTAEKQFVLEDGVYLFANLFAYSFPTLGIKRIHDIVREMDISCKRGSRISIEMTRRFCDEMFDFPYFSEHRYAFLNRKSGKIKGSLPSRMRRYLIPKLQKYWLFQKIVVEFLGNIIWPHMKENKGIFAVNERYLTQSQTIQKNNINVYVPKASTEVDPMVYSLTTAFFLTLDQL